MKDLVPRLLNRLLNSVSEEDAVNGHQGENEKRRAGEDECQEVPCLLVHGL